MNAKDLSQRIDYRLPSDDVSKEIIRQAFRELREYLNDVVVKQKGVVGFIVKIGLRKAIELLDDYLALRP